MGKVAVWMGGLASNGMLAGLAERDEELKTVLFPDAGGHTPAFVDYMNVVRRWLRETFRVDFLVASGNGKSRTLESWCLENVRLPPLDGFVACWRTFKLSPLFAKLESLRTDGQEMALLVPWREGEGPTSGLPRSWTAEPVLEKWGWSSTDCVDACLRVGLPTPIDKRCFFCPSKSKAEVRAMFKAGGATIHRAVSLELAAANNLGDTWSWAGLIQEPPLPNVAECSKPSCKLPVICESNI